MNKLIIAAVFAALTTGASAQSYLNSAGGHLDGENANQRETRLLQEIEDSRTTNGRLSTIIRVMQAEGNTRVSDAAIAEQGRRAIPNVDGNGNPIGMGRIGVCDAARDQIDWNPNRVTYDDVENDGFTRLEWDTTISRCGLTFPGAATVDGFVRYVLELEEPYNTATIDEQIRTTWLPEYHQNHVGILAAEQVVNARQALLEQAGGARIILNAADGFHSGETAMGRFTRLADEVASGAVSRDRLTVIRDVLQAELDAGRWPDGDDNRRTIITMINTLLGS